VIAGALGRGRFRQALHVSCEPKSSNLPLEEASLAQPGVAAQPRAVTKGFRSSNEGEHRRSN